MDRDELRWGIKGGIAVVLFFALLKAILPTSWFMSLIGLICLWGVLNFSALAVFKWLDNEGYESTSDRLGTIALFLGFLAGLGFVVSYFLR